MTKSNQDRPSPAARPRVAVVVSRYNASITDRLLAGAVARYEQTIGAGTPAIFHAPGAYELPALALHAANTGEYDGVVALGCLIRGETRHDRYIAEAVAHGLVQVTMQTGVPVAFGVLTVDQPRQAEARAGGKQGNKGEEAMAAVLETIAVAGRIARGESMTLREATAKPDKAKKPAKKAGDKKPSKQPKTKGRPGDANGHSA
jgi:6,7-dimethyl-8-ribityllumazine synthase